MMAKPICGWSASIHVPMVNVVARIADPRSSAAAWRSPGERRRDDEIFLTTQRRPDRREHEEDAVGLFVVSRSTPRWRDPNRNRRYAEVARHAATPASTPGEHGVPALADGTSCDEEGGDAGGERRVRPDEGRNSSSGIRDDDRNPRRGRKGEARRDSARADHCDRDKQEETGSADHARTRQWVTECFARRSSE